MALPCPVAVAVGRGDLFLANLADACSFLNGIVMLVLEEGHLLVVVEAELQRDILT